MSHKFKLSLLQMCYQGSHDLMLAHACEMIDMAASRGAEMVVLPELFATDYFCQKLDQNNFNLAESIDGVTNTRICEAARRNKIVIINSFYEKTAAGLYYNSVAVIDKEGRVVGLYRKTHIPHDPLFEEKYYFAPGDLGFQAINTEHCRVGPLICWDQWYPEAARLTALRGAELICYPTAIGWHPAEKPAWEKDQVDAWETIQRSHAIANGVFVAACNRVGHEKIIDEGIEFFGHSFICDPYGRILAVGSHDKEEIVTATIDLALVEEKRRNWPFFRDRRVDLYDDLSKRWIE